MQCYACGRAMKKIDRRVEMIELESADDVTEGQFADYLAAQESGDYGEWAQGVVDYQCQACGTSMTLASDNLADYGALIENWHARTKHGDYFSKFIFEYLAFMAFLKSHIALGSLNEREAIQILKRNDQAKQIYLDLVEKDDKLQQVLSALIKELKARPLHNSSRDYDNPQIDGWWNSSGDKPYVEPRRKRGVIHSLKDWENIVEFWHAIRNNLFHGGKDPSIRRDQFLVEHAFKTLNTFMNLRMEAMSAQNMRSGRRGPRRRAHRLK